MTSVRSPSFWRDKNKKQRKGLDGGRLFEKSVEISENLIVVAAN